MKKARIVILTGPGKGKTTSALGMILRALAYGKGVLLVRFCKASFSGELAMFEKLEGITVRGGRYGMTPPPEHPDYQKHVACARELFEFTQTAASGFDMIVLDEICGAAARGMIGEGDVVSFLRRLRPDQTAILTGRDAGPGLVEIADTVSEIRCVKHGLQQGIEAQDGVER